MVPIGELSAVDTAFLDLVPLPPLEDVADASPVWLHPDQNLSGRRYHMYRLLPEFR